MILRVGNVLVNERFRKWFREYGRWQLFRNFITGHKRMIKNLVKSYSFAWIKY